MIFESGSLNWLWMNLSCHHGNWRYPSPIMRLAIYIYKDLVKIPQVWMPPNLQEFRLLLVGWVYGHVSGLLMQHLWSLA